VRRLSSRMILSQQCTQLGVDILWRCGLGFAQGERLFPVLAGMDGILSDVDRSFREQLMEVLDVGLGQRLHSCLDDVVDAGEVVVGFDQVIDFDRFKAHVDLTCFEDLFHLCPHEPITGHAVIAVAKVDLDIVVQAMVDTLGLLLLQLFHHRRQILLLIFFEFRFLYIIRNKPDTIFLNRLRDSSFPAKPPNKRI